MFYALAPHIHVASFGDRFVVLDLKRDRYRLLVGDLAAALAGLLSGTAQSDEPAVQTLVEQGFLEAGASLAPPATVPIARRSALEPGDGGDALPLVPTALHLLGVLVRLRILGLARVIGAAARRAARARSTGSTDAEAARLARAYACARHRIPIARVCLSDSLALLDLLTRRNVTARLVLGVRLDPFAAHSWVQRGDLLLNDQSDLITGYRPILVI